ncbi:hypothetical protein V7S43_018208 [Phytophthora oleae]|uniref:t-SNARE coiled-coil homology domain-containing protein n=1 Tax=Phytophthora oleae TaxID=2107226 RepID=A0ABD3EQZ3_9STRA
MEGDHAMVHGEEDVWSSFDKSVAYMKEVAALYESAFGCRGDGQTSSTSRKAVTKAHLDEAHNQAQQALELLASNLLNASMTIVNSIEKQESDADLLANKVSTIRQKIKDCQAELDQEAIRKFYSSHKASKTNVSTPTTPQQLTGHESEPPRRVRLSIQRGSFSW